MSANDEKKCFIITPIGGDNTDIRRAAEGVIDAVIMPILINEGYLSHNITVAHRMAQPGSINKQLITRILEDDLVIANLTNLNPNVMYELAIRHASRKPVIQICEQGTRLPFDIVEERTIFYTNDMLGTVQLRSGLSTMISEILRDESLPDNPIYRVVEGNLIQKSDLKDTDKYMIKRMDKLEELLLSVVNKVNSEPLSRPLTHNKSSNIEKTVVVEYKGILQEDVFLKEIHKQLEISPLKFVRSIQIHHLGVSPVNKERGVSAIAIGFNDPENELDPSFVDMLLRLSATGKGIEIFEIYALR